MSEPVLTRAQLEVADCMSQGWQYSRIAAWLGITEATVRVHVLNIALKLPDDDIPPYQRVFLWSAHRRWLQLHPPSNNSAA